jgi:hypothetical protein
VRLSGNPEDLTFLICLIVLVAGKLGGAPAYKHRRGPSTTRYKASVRREIREALRSG